MKTNPARMVGQLSVDEFRELIGQVIEEKLQHHLALAFYYDEDGVRTASVSDSEDDLPLKAEFEESLRSALQEVEAGRTTPLTEVRKRHEI